MGEFLYDWQSATHYHAQIGLLNNGQAATQRLVVTHCLFDYR